MRVIFNEKIDESKRRSVIIHRLKLQYGKDGKTKKFYVSLDSEDLMDLKKQIERAFEKEKLSKNINDDKNENEMKKINKHNVKKFMYYSF